MIRTRIRTFIFCLPLSLVLFPVPQDCFSADFEIDISPKVLNLNCGGEVITVHTNIDYSDVDGDVYLRLEENKDCESGQACCEVRSTSSKSDLRGDFVAKFPIEDVVKDLCLTVGSYRLLLVGIIDGVPFEAAQACTTVCEEVQVINDTVCPLLCTFSDGSEEITLLRNFRDNLLTTTVEGQTIIALYYHWSPLLVKLMNEDETLKEVIKEQISEILPLIRKAVE